METRNTPVLREIIEVLSSEVDTMHLGGAGGAIYL